MMNYSLFIRLALLALLSTTAPVHVHAFMPLTGSHSRQSAAFFAHAPRAGIGQWLLRQALESPLWKAVLVPQARQKIISTAEENGIEWNHCKAWLEASNGPWTTNEELDVSHVPAYYREAFHAYQAGNLCWEAALEVELASAAVGARNFPTHGQNGEAAFRRSFEVALDEIGATVKDGDVIVDLGCGTGMSTRRLASKFPQASRIVGIDLSPYFIQVGKSLSALAPKSKQEGGEWVSSVSNDSRIDYRVGDAADTGVDDDSVDICNLQFVAHELPHAITEAVVQEAHRILKPGGQLWVCEMDFESPGFSKQRANPLLFALIRSTEPYLDEYADHSKELREKFKRTFGRTVVTAATGRHFALVATKGGEDGTLQDLRFDEDGNYRVEDTHLRLWENRKD
jgi:ubiquinone/menaquinone biosynthesis C-methylase UbiE